MQATSLKRRSTRVLREEHAVVERVLDLLEQHLQRIKDSHAVPSEFAPWTVGFFRTFADRCHHRKEEVCLFPLLEKRGIAQRGGPIGVMLEEHTLGRDCLRRMDEALRGPTPDQVAFAQVVKEYTALLRQHIAKENNILFPIADQALSDEDDAHLMQAFEQAEHDQGLHEAHAQFEAELEHWERHFERLGEASDDLESVVSSYYRCEESGGFFDTFYEIFFNKSPEIPPLFAATDMEKQKQIVMASLLWLLRLNRDDPVARHEVGKLAVSHGRHGHNVWPELYDLWLDALCDSVARHDPDYTPRLEAQWRRLMATGVDLMKSKY